jgi:hypothetical protein
MKKIVLFLILLLVPSIVSAQAINVYSRDAFTSGVGALTAINATTAALKTGDIAYVKIQNDATYGTGLFIYFYVSDSGATVAAPNIYKPAAGTTDGRWIRTIPYIETADIKTMEAGTNPTPTSIYNLSSDSNGAGATGDRIIRALDSAGNQWPVGQRITTFAAINFTKPLSWPTARRNNWEVVQNRTGMTFTITEISCESDLSTSLVFKTSTSLTNSTISKTIGTVAISSARTGGGFAATVTSLTNYTISTGELLVVDFHDTDDPDGGSCQVRGYYNAAVN